MATCFLTWSSSQKEGLWHVNHPEIPSLVCGTIWFTTSGSLSGQYTNKTSCIQPHLATAFISTLQYSNTGKGLLIPAEMCSERDSPLQPFVLPSPGQPELARLTCGAHLGPPVLTRKQKHSQTTPWAPSHPILHPRAGWLPLRPHSAVTWLAAGRLILF